MQTVGHTIEYKSIHPVFDDLDRFYCLTSTRNMQVSKPLIRQQYDWSFEYLHSLFEEYGDTVYDIDFIDKQYKPLNLPKYNKKNIILAFSGGKDSTASILYYKNEGYNVYLYHALGINKAYPDEWKSAQAIADYLNVPIYFEKILINGKQEFPEHPMKNMIIANHALYYGIKNNIGTKIAFGNYEDGDLEVESFYTAGDDSVQMWEAYEDIIHKALPQFKIYIGLKDVNNSLELLRHDKNLLALCQSCVGAQRFRQFNHDNNEQKYGIKLLPNRCGSCWKCAMEYIYMADHNTLEYSREYYKHCLNVLRKNAKLEHGVEVKNTKELWNGYFKYSVEKSKYYRGE